MKTLFILILLFPLYAFGQQTGLHTLASQGDFEKSGNMSLSWTLGELFTETVTSENQVVTQGFQQPNIEIIRLSSTDDKSHTASLFPNPTQGWLKLQMTVDSGKYRVDIFDNTGRIMTSTWYDDPEVILNISNYPTGQYIIRVANSASDTQAAYSVLKF